MSVLYRAHTASAKKPGKWPVSLGRVDPLWRWVFRDLAFAFVYWNGQVFEVRTSSRPNTSTGGNSSLLETPYGVGIDHTGRLEFDSFSPMNPGTGGVTLLTYANANASDRQTLVCQRVGNQNEHLELRAGQRFASGGAPGTTVTEGSHLFFQCDDGGAGTDAQGASTSGGAGTGPLDGDWHVLAGRRTAGGTTSVWSDGEDVTGHEQTGNTDDINDAGTFVLGGLPGTSTIAYQDDKLLDMGWNRDLSDREMKLIAEDPFGWMRMTRTSWTVVSTGTPVDNTRLARMAFAWGLPWEGP